MTVPVETRYEQGVLVIGLKGELDHHAVEQIRDRIEQQLEEHGYRGLVMSFRNIDFMDSSGLGLILGRYRTVMEHGGKMALCEVSAPLRRLFEMSGLLKILPVYESEEAAMAAILGA
ncbi:anti-sigma-factor antagonist [Alicyclobacillus hesperidum URH17-3-68]|uniref:Anti-sigma F factor antagonist n=1 Tax=Alicyclobacillus hesperidum TaxID=89784 RepID=A0AA37X440_9BACL|nr:anti-sigma F factor antagonist [Alicyclobacillus hesperidum]EJY56397.1 anti-sigma-factor antagonist [Alicyclobacillus hesperidum URH17-3-68]GLG01005.1 anti-sigma F factor antagonist [Alicyclobacillus hesperidum subsp. aegles]GLV13717.1 anti-sigma F factor antagonist [Alicyclobacillus hesperidum]